MSGLAGRPRGRRVGVRLAPAILLAVLAPGVATPGDWEIGLSGGKVVPFYHQTFEYDPGSIARLLPGTTVLEHGTFRLDARGALALDGTLAYYASPVVGLEARLDTADVAVDTVDARYRLRVDLPSPLPPLTTEVDLGTGSVDLQRLRPMSLDLKLRTPGRVRATASAGVSYLPAVRLVARQGVGIGLPSLSRRAVDVDVLRVPLRAEARPRHEGEGRFGANAGAGLQYPLSPRMVLTFEGRYFYFQRQTLVWSRAPGEDVLPSIQEEIARELEARLPAVRFNPQFFHVSAGLVLTF